VTSFLRRYGGWILALAFLNWLVWMAFELGHSRQLSERDIWPLRMYLASGLLLFDNLCVLWWYAHTTQELAVAAQDQARQRIREWRIQNKPVVFLDRDTTPSHASADGHAMPYVVRNVGPGIAINVYLLSAQGDGRWDVETIGALEPGASRVLPEHVDQRLEAHAGRLSGRLVVAEAMRMRTAQWMVTVNMPDKTGQVRHGYLSESVADGVHTLQELLTRHGLTFRERLERFRSAAEDTRS
jgi:hypothetical protein